MTIEKRYPLIVSCHGRAISLIHGMKFNAYQELSNPICHLQICEIVHILAYITPFLASRRTLWYIPHPGLREYALYQRNDELGSQQQCHHIIIVVFLTSEDGLPSPPFNLETNL